MATESRIRWDCLTMLNLDLLVKVWLAPKVTLDVQRPIWWAFQAATGLCLPDAREQATAFVLAPAGANRLLLMHFSIRTRTARTLARRPP
jgi:hypothetical protein